jgi:integrase/recombinase XerD
VSNRLGSLYAFLRYFIEHDLADAQLLARKIKLKVPDALPRAMAPEDVKCLLAVLEDVRNRAMILLLLRTGTLRLQIHAGIGQPDQCQASGFG